MLTSEGLRCVWNSFLLDAYKQVKLGGEAPNSNVIHIPNGTAESSSNCRWKSSMGKYGIYIDEAHPSDGWAAPGISSSFEVKKHRNQEDRCAAAHQLLKKFSLPPQCQIVADCMDNNANVAYGVSFERVCIIQRQKIAYLGGKGPFFYNLQEVRLWLEQNFRKR
ncbi:hypothetical protein E2320_021467 [Naja naja]|nr:hypothetical protein E2320_021467 [Naja naja]